MSIIYIINHTHTAPPAVSLKPNFIRGLTKKREFKSKQEILNYYNTLTTAKDIVRSSTEVRYTYEEVRVVLTIDGKPITIKIPPFFVYDGESIGWLQNFNARGSRLASLLHDWLYYKNEYPKSTCDDIMYQIQLYRGVPKIVAKGVNLGLILFGRSSYSKYSK